MARHVKQLLAALLGSIVLVITASTAPASAAEVRICTFYAVQGGCTAGPIRANGSGHYIYMTAIQNSFSCCFARGTYRLRDVDNGIVVASGSFLAGPGVKRRINGLYGLYRIELSCNCSARGSVSNA